mgnify:CR=1 FL=1
MASQLIGWQIDLYGSREWLERGEDLTAFVDEPVDDNEYETADFPLSELDLMPAVLAALSEVGYHTFLQIIDLERRDFLVIKGLGEEDAGRLLQLIDELTVVEEAEAEEPDAAAGNEEAEKGSDGYGESDD